MLPTADRFISFQNASVLQPSRSMAPRMLAWDVPPEELVHIPAHWLAYPEPDHMLHYILAIIYTMLFFVAIIGNGFVIYLFLTSKPLRSPSNIFVLNLAIADFAMMAKAPIFIYNSLFYGFVLGQFWCQVFATVGSMSGILQSTTNMCIAYDRYKNISDPMGGRMTMGKAVIMALMTWLYALPWTLMPLLEVWGRFVPEGYLTSCTFDYLTTTSENQMFVLTIFIFAYCVPMFFIVMFYSQIVGHICEHEKALREQAKKMNVASLRSGDQAAESAEVRIAKTAIGICSLFVASWTPYAVIALMGTFGNQELITPTVSMVPAICCKLVACFDPYVYAISHPRFRAELQKRMPGLFACINEQEPAAKPAANAETATQNPDA